jgi:hypothetical protein
MSSDAKTALAQVTLCSIATCPSTGANGKKRICTTTTSIGTPLPIDYSDGWDQQKRNLEARSQLVGIFNKFVPHESAADGGQRSVSVTVDIGKTLGGVVVGIVLIVIAAILYDDAGWLAFFALGEAVVVGVLGISVGEKTGGTKANDAIQTNTQK